MSDQILVINCGSSSIKFSLVDPEAGTHVLSGQVERIGSDSGFLSWKGAVQGENELGPTDHRGAMHAIVKVLRDSELDFAGIGHRVVHGGEHFTASCRINDESLEVLRAHQHLAPLHNPVNILGIEASRTAFPDKPQVMVFDTAFHQTMPRRAYLYALPHHLYTEHGVRRYGFHGTSHRYVAARAAEQLGRPLADLALLSAHLGNGCSAAAVLGGKSMDTTMGLTPLEGLVMGTRSGDVDPSLHEHLCNTLNLSLKEISALLNKQSGLLGLSGGHSNDMRTLLQAEAGGHEGAALAVEVFCYRLAKALAAQVVALGRLDALIFTGGIGENSTPVRARTVALLPFLGLHLDSAANEDHGRANRGIITTTDAPCAMVVQTDEELLIARDTASIILQPEISP
ncbi:MAG: acetate kinase [Verrucomicrobia bacterium]|nr:acetate kinase [Verrucomicrobiota bacterium]MCH8528033.1 acetate kinase [Kiritimatiellia bacterium]